MSQASSSKICKYDVFLSFRGVDTRKNIVSHLYNALQQRGIRTFKDDERLETGKSISDELLKAIEEARFAVVIFSKSYASSRWCLEELAHIIKCKNELEQIVIPVFYDVSPSDVRHQSPPFADSFSQHEEKYKDDMEKVQRWRDAFVEAGNLSGHHLPNFKDEAKCIKKIVDDIFPKLLRIISPLPKNLVGMETQVEKVTSLLDMESNDVRSIGIWGMGGIGKTEIANVLHQRYRHRFEVDCFLGDVGKLHQNNGLTWLQELVICKLMGERMTLTSKYEQMNILKNLLCGKKVLFILDDVNHREQLGSLVGGLEWFGMGSRIILTARDKHLLISHVGDNVYEVQLLSEDEALELFSRHAFKEKSPKEDFMELSRQVVKHVGGLPEDQVTESNILAEGPEWVAKGLMSLKDDDTFHREGSRSPDLQLVLATPRFDRTPSSVVQPLDVLVDGDASSHGEDEMPLIRRLQRRIPPSAPDHSSSKDQVAPPQDTPPVSALPQEPTRSYPTRHAQKRRLHDAIAANKAKTVAKRRLFSTSVIEEEISSKKLVSLDDVAESNDDASDDDFVSLKLKTEITAPKTRKSRSVKEVVQSQKQGTEKPKWSDPASTRKPGSHVKKVRLDKGSSREDRMRLLAKQKVLGGRVFEPNAKSMVGMRDLVDSISLQGWDHLFDWSVPTLYEWEVRQFYNNVEIQGDGSFVTSIGDISFRVDEVFLGSILKVDRAGIRSVVDCAPAKGFLLEVGKVPNLNTCVVSKIFLKGQYQLYFEFVNKVLLPRSEKRTITTMADLFLMEALITLEAINLPAVMMEHMTKVLTTKEGRHGLPYGYLLNNVFEHFGIRLRRGVPGTIKQSFSQTTLVECECSERHAGVRKSQISEFLAQQETLKDRVEELTAALAAKDAELLSLRATVAAGISREPGLDELARLKDVNTQQAQEIKSLTQQLLRAHEDSNARLTLLLQSLAPKPSPP